MCDDYDECWEDFEEAAEGFATFVIILFIAIPVCLVITCILIIVCMRGRQPRVRVPDPKTAALSDNVDLGDLGDLGDTDAIN